MSGAEVVVRHAALALAVLALAGAGTRVAWWAGARGLTLLAAAAPVAAALAVAEALGLGLVALGGNAVALTLLAVATWVVSLRLPGPRAAAGLRDWWARASTGTRVLTGALAGAWAAWSAWLVAYPAFGHDMLGYHLPEAIAWVQEGTPGSVEDLVVGLPVGYYPVTHEVLLAWGMGIGSSFVWPTLVTAAAPLLAALAVCAMLRALGAARLVAGLAGAAAIATPGVLASQSGGASLDPAALAWVCCGGCLAVQVGREPRLLVPALLAGGLAIGTKTTAATLVIVAIAYGLYAARGRLRPMLAPLSAAALGAFVVGCFWYARNLVEHGSPLWPFVSGPFGDDRPLAIERADVSFVDRPGATWEALDVYYRDHFAGPALLLAAALVAALLVRRRAVLIGAALVVVSILLWLQAPFTGLYDERLNIGVGDATRYLLPGVAAAALTLGLASRAGDRARMAVAGVLGAAVALGLWNTFEMSFPSAPSPATPLAGAAAGALVALALARLHLALPALPAAAWVAAAVAVAGVGGAVAADGYAERHAKTGTQSAGVAGFLAADPRWRDGDQPVASTFAGIAPLAGDHLEHDLVLIRPRDPCAEVQARRMEGFVVTFPRDPTGRCFTGERALYRDAHHVLYGPP